MPVVILDGSTVRDFVNDTQAFNESMEARFKETDLNEDGSLSRSELRAAFERMRLLESSFGVPIAQTPVQLNALYGTSFLLLQMASVPPHSKSSLKRVVSCRTQSSTKKTLLAHKGIDFLLCMSLRLVQ